MPFIALSAQRPSGQAAERPVSTLLIQQYDQLHRDIEPWFGITPDVFRKRAAGLVDAKFS